MTHRLGTVAVALLSLFLAACTGSEEPPTADPTTAPSVLTASPTVAATPATKPPADAPLAYLALGSDGLVRVEVESGAFEPFIDYATLGAAEGAPLILRLGDDHLWVATSPGRIVRLDPWSGDVLGVTEFPSTQPIADFGVRGGFLWVLAGQPFGNAVLLGIDRNSGQLVFNLEPPPGGELGGLAVGNDYIWVIGGDPDSDRAISRIDPGSGRLDGTFETGIAGERLVFAGGSIWVVGYGGNIAGSTIARVDPGNGELLDLTEAYVWVEVLAGTEAGLWYAGVAGTLKQPTAGRVEFDSNSVDDVFFPGQSGGDFRLAAGDGHIFIVNQVEDRTYWGRADASSLTEGLPSPLAPLLVLE